MESLENNDKINPNNNDKLSQIGKELNNIIDYIQINIDNNENSEIDSKNEFKQNKNDTILGKKRKNSIYLIENEENNEINLKINKEKNAKEK